MKITDLQIKRFWMKVEITDGCWVWKGSTTDGYGNVDLICDGKRKGLRAHRVAYFLKHKKWPRLLMHQCDNRKCVRPHRDHVFVGTPKRNIRDMVKKGRHWTQLYPERVPRGVDHWTHKRPNVTNHGELNANAKLSNVQVEEIKKRLMDGETQSSLAREYGVWTNAIWRIANGEHSSSKGVRILPRKGADQPRKGRLSP